MDGTPPKHTVMAEPNRFDPREFFGWTGQPLAIDTRPRLPQDVTQRFERAGYGAAVPYLNPWETLARAQGYRDMGRTLQVQDAPVSETSSPRTRPRSSAPCCASMKGWE
jgi:hypothetical protein